MYAVESDVCSECRREAGGQAGSVEADRQAVRQAVSRHANSEPGSVEARSEARSTETPLDDPRRIATIPMDPLLRRPCTEGCTRHDEATHQMMRPHIVLCTTISAGQLEARDDAREHTMMQNSTQ